MKRLLYKKLLDWKNSKNRKPLLLQGARQVGKTYLVNQFGKNEYATFIYLNFEQNPYLGNFFENILSPHKIIENLSLYLGKKIDSIDTLIFFDEIQISPKALTSLKYFYEQASEFQIIAAGSLLGVSIGKSSSFPVGKVNFLNLYPLNFIEYLNAFDENLLAQKIETITTIEALPEPIHNKLISHLKQYLFLGGMPEVVQDYINNHDIESARKIQNDILESYKNDFSKYTDRNQAVKTSELWNSIPYQLAKENKKFKYADVKKKARASTYEQTIEWLNNAGLINLVYNISVPKLPLAGYADNSKFKIYLLDSGILGAMLKISSKIILEPTALFSEYNGALNEKLVTRGLTALFSEYNGAFIENFVTSELTALNYDKLFYWTSKSDAEVDFIIQKENNIYPVEVKSGLNRNMKSLKSYSDKYNPKLKYRLSPRNYIQSDNFINLPLYAVCYLKNDL